MAEWPQSSSDCSGRSFPSVREEADNHRNISVQSFFFKGFWGLWPQTTWGLWPCCWRLFWWCRRRAGGWLRAERLRPQTPTQIQPEETTTEQTVSTPDVTIAWGIKSHSTWPLKVLQFNLVCDRRLTLSTSQVEAAPPGKIFSIFTTGWTLDSIPPDILMPETVKQHESRSVGKLSSSNIRQ